MTGYGSQGPPDDPSNRPTRMASYGSADPEPPGFDDYPDYTKSAEPESPPAPWYRNRSLLAVWATMVAILVVLIIYGLIQLSRGGGGSSTTTPSTTSTPTRSSTATTTTPPSPATTPEVQQPPEENSPAPAEPPAEPPRHHHHLPHIPSTITLPHTVITLPPGF